MTHVLIQESIDKRQHVRDLLTQTPDDYISGARTVEVPFPGRGHEGYRRPHGHTHR